MAIEFFFDKKLGKTIGFYIKKNYIQFAINKKFVL